jgi:hypothetical protein
MIYPLLSTAPTTIIGKDGLHTAGCIFISLAVAYEDISFAAPKEGITYAEFCGVAKVARGSCHYNAYVNKRLHRLVHRIERISQDWKSAIGGTEHGSRRKTH